MRNKGVDGALALYRGAQRVLRATNLRKHGMWQPFHWGRALLDHGREESGGQADS
jgi:hypothetical protein